MLSSAGNGEGGGRVWGGISERREGRERVARGEGLAQEGSGTGGSSEPQHGVSGGCAS